MKYQIIVTNTWEIIADNFATELDAWLNLWDIDLGQYDDLGGLTVTEYRG